MKYLRGLIKQMGIDLRLIGLLILGVIFCTSLGISKVMHVSLISGLAGLFILGLTCILTWLVLSEEKTDVLDPTSHLVLGEYQNKLFRWIKEGDFVLRLKDFRHVLVTGMTGFGKSTFIRRFIDEVLKTGNRFCYVDFKGEHNDHEELLKICERHGIVKELQVFDLSNPETCLSCNLLTIFPQVEETVGFITGLFFDDKANEYYKNEAERFLRFSIQLLDAAGIERTLSYVNDLFYNEMTRKHLLLKARKKAKGNEPFLLYFESEFSKLTDRDRSERFSGFTSLLSSFTSEPLGRIFNGEGDRKFDIGHIFERNIPVIIRVPGESYGELSVRIIQSFIKSIPVLLSKRRLQSSRNDYFILLDEGCSYVNETLSDLLKKAGSANVKILLTRMCDADFDSVATAFRGKMLSAFSVFVCFQTNDPDTRETLSRLSMTQEDEKFTRKLSASGETGEGSARDVQKFTIHPTEFGRLKVGEFILIAPSLDLFKRGKILPAKGTL